MNINIPKKHVNSVNTSCAIMASIFVSTIDSMHRRLYENRTLTEELITSYLENKGNDDHDTDRNPLLRFLVLLLAMGVVGVIIFFTFR